MMKKEFYFRVTIVAHRHLQPLKKDKAVDILVHVQFYCKNHNLTFTTSDIESPKHNKPKFGQIVDPWWTILPIHIGVPWTPFVLEVNYKIIIFLKPKGVARTFNEKKTDGVFYSISCLVYVRRFLNMWHRPCPQPDVSSVRTGIYLKPSWRNISFFPPF